MLPDTKIPENCPAWLAQWIGKSDTRLGNIEKTLVHFVKLKAGKHNSNPESEDKDSDKVTFKWLAETFLVPAMFLLTGYLIARSGG